MARRWPGASSRWVLAAFVGAACVQAAPAGCGPGGGGSGGTGGVAGAAGASGAAGSPSGGGSAGAAGNASGGAAGGGGTGGTGGNIIDASDEPPGDAGAGATGGSPSDASTDAPQSVVCGDGIRGLDEECDDGNAAENDACLSNCTVADFLAVPASVPDGAVPAAGRYLGEGRHPVAANDAGFAVVYVEPGFTPPRVGITAFDPKGVRVGSPIAVSTSALLTSDPVLAALPGGKYAAAWSDFGGDGDALGVAVRVADPASPSGGATIHANTTTDFSQFDPDALWTGTELVVAWADDSDAVTGPDLRYRVFDAALSPKNNQNEQTLANDSAIEGAVCLAPFAGSWAAAWRASATGGTEMLVAKSGSVTWNVGPHAPAGAEDKPALVELDGTTLLAVFTVGDGGSGAGSKLSCALLDTASPGSATAFSLKPTSGTGGAVPAQSHPNAVRVGTRVYLTWRASAQTGDPLAEELWLREVTWSAGILTLLEPIALPRSTSHQQGDQRFPALAASPLFPEGALVTAWDDYGLVFGAGQGAPDVVVELIPTPILRKSSLSVDGGGQ